MLYQIKAYQLPTPPACVLVSIRIVFQLLSTLEELHHERIGSPAHEGRLPRGLTAQ